MLSNRLLATDLSATGRNADGWLPLLYNRKEPNSVPMSVMLFIPSRNELPLLQPATPPLPLTLDSDFAAIIVAAGLSEDMCRDTKARLM